MNLLLDIGNSRIKWACRDGVQLIHHGAAVRDESLFSVLTAAWQGLPKPKNIVASNVAGDEFADQLEQFLQTHWSLRVQYATVEQGWDGLVIAYPEPQLFGVDRWLALIAARHLYSGAVCVIDCGTAVTIDAVDRYGKHLGGVIVPGLDLMRGTLMQRSSGVNRGINIINETSAAVLGSDTRSGVERGALYAIAGGIAHTLSKVKTQINAPITSIITGGDANRVLAELGGEYEHSPHLVLHGLQLLSGR